METTVLQELFDRGEGARSTDSGILEKHGSDGGLVLEETPRYKIVVVPLTKDTWHINLYFVEEIVNDSMGVEGTDLLVVGHSFTHVDLMSSYLLGLIKYLDKTYHAFGALEPLSFSPEELAWTEKDFFGGWATTTALRIREGIKRADERKRGRASNGGGLSNDEWDTVFALLCKASNEGGG